MLAMRKQYSQEIVATTKLIHMCYYMFPHSEIYKNIFSYIKTHGSESRGQ